MQNLRIKIKIYFKQIKINYQVIQKLNWNKFKINYQRNSLNQLCKKIIVNLLVFVKKKIF
jgi:hypothetical protein